MSYAVIAVAILVLLVLFKIMKGLLKLLLLIIVVLAGVYYVGSARTNPPTENQHDDNASF